jgi:hypothetical protein
MRTPNLLPLIILLCYMATPLRYVQLYVTVPALETYDDVIFPSSATQGKGSVAPVRICIQCGREKINHSRHHRLFDSGPSHGPPFYFLLSPTSALKKIIIIIPSSWLVSRRQTLQQNDPRTSHVEVLGSPILKPRTSTFRFRLV